MSTENDDRRSNLRDNEHRSLRELVSVNAWFVQSSENPNRFTLHAGVSFNEERLGGGSGTKVNFKLAVKRCDIIFVPPLTDPFQVDPASVRMPRPLKPSSVSEEINKRTKAKASAKLSLKPNPINLDAEASHEREYDRSEKSTQEVSAYNEQWKRVSGNHAWSVDGKSQKNERLSGPVFDAQDEPRLTVIDGRSQETKSRHKERNLNPVATVRVRCLREDIDIYEISFTDPNEQRLFERKSHREEKLMTAREILKEALVNEGLAAGEIATNPYAEMTVCDVSISIIDNSS